MKKITILILVLLLGYSGSAMAIPMLQLDIVNGVYDEATDTTFATTDPFTLRALFDGDRNEDTADLLNDTFYISASLVPNSGVSDTSILGSFTISDGINDDRVISVTGDMDYGTAPLDTIAGWDAQYLPKHGIFPTYFIEHAFNFSESTTSAYNTAGGSAPDRKLYLSEFVITTNLAEGYSLHFDLYHTVVKEWIKKGIAIEDIDTDMFAPFSHDAQSGPVGGPAPVPEPTTILLLSSGLFGFAGYMRRKKSQK